VLTHTNAQLVTEDALASTLLSFPAGDVRVLREPRPHRQADPNDVSE
jgi:hypothetical protein